MIVVTTPTGQIGAQVLAGLLDAPGTAPSVRVIARDPARLPADVRARVEVVAGSHADPAVLKEACAGADRIFWLVPPTPGAASVDGHFRDFTEPLRDVVGGDGIRRVVGVSTLGRGVAENAGQISASLAMDETIAAMDVHYRALCPPFLMENLLHQVAAIHRTGMFFLATTEDRVLRTCATGDIAATAVRLLLDDAWTGTEDVPLVGPDDLSPQGMADVLSEVLDRPVRFRRTTGAEYRATLVGFGASDAWARGLADMVDSLDAQGYYGADAPSTPETAPTTFRRWCEEVLRPAVRA
ncbi:NAD(P)H-binding protein [Embleya hyalina]|uniref:NmrA family transcriptional regulator n=1 Tax=Embleya hyalina TaxID=516124 RepID=A0A401YSH6_9ACTN|nr:NAD(P)H-binding protein [Embleya hyalina]GCD97515.1 NmrA family transcriptional regulator [Embleya hyalina]